VSTTADGITASRLRSSEARFSRFAWGVLAYNVLVVLWGALVRATGSGAGCGGHWPLCNGEVVPSAPAAATLIEYTHRIMSGLALIAVIGLWLWSRRLFPRRHRVRKWAGLSVTFLVIEALLGAGLVLLNYVAHNASVGRGFYLAAHLANTQLLLGVLALTAWLAARGDTVVALGSAPKSLLAALPLVVVLSMTGAVAALGDTLFPASSLAAGIKQDFSPAAHLLLRLRLLHPPFAVLLGFYVLYAASSAVRSRPFPPVKRLAAVVALLVLLQLAAGAINVALLAPMWMQLTHLLVADLVWIALVMFTASTALPVPDSSNRVGI
jgi:cytochrome c oxidase assembly protein subunit 15